MHKSKTQIRKRNRPIVVGHSQLLIAHSNGTVLSGIFDQDLGERVQLDLPDVALTAQERVAERVAAAPRLVIQRHVALLAAEALDVKVLLHGADAYRLAGARGRYDHLCHK